MRRTSGWISSMTFSSMDPTMYKGKRGAFLMSAPVCTSAFACAMLVVTRLDVESFAEGGIPERASTQASIAPTSRGKVSQSASAMAA